MGYSKILEKVEQLPFDPGCYLYKNSAGEIIYVGKAKSLRKRVRQYFDRYHYADPKIEVLVSQIADIDFVTVKSEIEALVLETNLIKKYRPRYNKLQKDDKQYAWIEISNEAFPKIFRTREKKRDKGEYFGPYPDGNAARITLNSLRRIYPFRICSKAMFEPSIVSNTKEKFSNANGTFRFTKNSRLCLDYHLGLCPGVCDNLISSEKYLQTINRIRDFLKGKSLEALKLLKFQMNEYAANQEFEMAAKVRDQITELSYIQQKIHIAYGEDENRVKAKKMKAAESIAKNLFEKLNLKNHSENLRIECFDVSNIQGTNPVTSMVVSEKGLMKKSDYRYFRIRLKETPDDFHMMEEALERRFKYLTPFRPSLSGRQKDESFSKAPDLVIVDGGKGQLGIALQVLAKLNLSIPAVGIAKREEEIIQKGKRSFKIYRINKNSKILQLVQQIRDEAHRFAITRHRNLRGKKALETVLMEIPGVGDKSVTKLLRHFGTVENIRQAEFEELAKVLNNKAKAAEVIRFFK